MTGGILLPEEFLARMRELLAEDEYMAFLSCFGRKRLFSLRINTLKTEREKALPLLQKALSGLPGDTRDPLEGLSPAETEKDLQKEGLQPVPWEPDGYYYPETFRPGRMPWHEAGMYYIQEASAMAPAMLCGAKPGDRILDLCAAPGGKSTKLAASLCGEGILVANEIHPERAKVLSSNLERMGVRNALVTNEAPQRLASRFPLFFDKIVVDAPCSGEGMFRKEEEALAHWSPENVRMCSERQTQILDEAAAMLRSGGRLVYSTCTFSPEENEAVIFRFLADHPDFSVVSIPDLSGIKMKEQGFSCGRAEWLPAAGIEIDRLDEERLNIAKQLGGTLRLWPHLLNGEGHFAAVLKKSKPHSAETAAIDKAEDAALSYRALTGSEKPEKDRPKKKKEKGKKQHRGKRPDGDLSLREMQRMWEEFCSENLLPCPAPDAVTDFNEDRLCMFGNALFGLPLPASQLSMDGLKVLRAGLHLGTVNRNRFEPSHALAMALRRNEVFRSIEFEGASPQAFAWIRGESISVDPECEKGWTLVLIDGCSAGWGKVNGGILKNHYPKGLRKGSNYTNT